MFVQSVSNVLLIKGARQAPRRVGGGPRPRATRVTPAPPPFSLPTLAPTFFLSFFFLYIYYLYPREIFIWVKSRIIMCVKEHMLNMQKTTDSHVGKSPPPAPACLRSLLLEPVFLH